MSSNSSKRKVVALGLFEDEEDLIAAKIEPKPVVFKKIKKETAAQLKQEYDDEHDVKVKKESMTSVKREQSEPEGIQFIPQVKKESKLSQLAKREKLEMESEKLIDQTPISDIEDDIQVDRDWYNADELGHGFDDPYPFGGDFEQDEQREAQLKTQERKRQSTRSIRNKEAETKWFQNRIQASGIKGQHRSEVDLFVDDEDEEALGAKIMTHRLVPPFLKDSVILTKQKENVDPIRDPTGDLATSARKGSELVNERRHQREREKQAKEAVNASGTTLDSITTKTLDQEASRKPHESSHGETELESEPTLEDIKAQRKTLPAYQVRDEVLKVIGENQVTIVIGETGSGKTTQLTQFLYESGYQTTGMIGCTQPRRVAAMSVAKRVSEEMGVRLGDAVGFTIRFEDKTSSKTKIKYMTDGILLREFLIDPDLDKYSCIIMDEAHERSLNTDILLGLFKSILTRRRDLKLIVTSATMNADRFSRFFGGAPQFTIPGRTFPVETYYSMAPSSDYVDAAVRQVLRIHTRNDPGDILVFMTGQEDIEATCDEIEFRLKKLGEENVTPLQILPIYSSLPADLQAKIFQKSPVRKCIVATNIAETSLTVDGVMFVIDTGLSKLKVFNSKLGMDTLQITPISMAQANQRSGRAGRTGPGIAYRLFTESSARNEMYVQPIPEIQRSNLANTLLLLKSLNVKDLLKFPFLDSPPEDIVNSSLYDLWAIGALDNFGNLTKLGAKMCNFPMEPSLSKLLIMSSQYGCSKEIVIIVSMLSVPNVFYRPRERQQQSDQARERFFVPESDHLTMLNVYEQWIANKSSEKWCQKHYLHHKSLRRARDIKSQLEAIMERQDLVMTSSGTDWDIIRKCICSCFYPNASKVKSYGEYVGLRSGFPMSLHPTSALYGLGDQPTYVVYHELIMTGKEYMNIVSSVDPDWLCEFGPMFYSFRDERVTSRENQRNKELAFERHIEEQKRHLLPDEKMTRKDDKKKAETDLQKLKNRRKRIGF
ncbi:unnamed protein product [Kuraishia capsulata CBS 1993]|uniref:Pre-mRNA-splicing factor ATP-dependent RNA helicase PRP16 n=1 Tax=Kuraishia capsulata CBS 1993 TaxID=1382522 RepID=W6MNG0_9ASCO|nr:uncharacterized protein KUCA_T00004181001 [Kuraishia capsulata CBS 1993]CDK28199.1 unnamed protein product [Kuraishia capsulata CBS 1993]